ncbi:MAG TPA: phosphotransferase family protein [Myxococcota bacterium]|nr:phosphotransferase family protein [Myxococcota bacterium]
MSGADAREAIERRLCEILPQPLRAEVTGTASLGAQRSTFFIEMIDGERRTPAVAQISGGALAQGDVEIEARLLREARRAGVPVPELLAWDAEHGLLVTRRVEGESIPRRILRRVEADPALGVKLAEDCGRALAGIHRLPLEPFEGLPDAREPLRYVDELAATLDTLDPPLPSLRLGLRWLRRHAPRPYLPGAVVHGDLRNGNLLVQDTGLAAVLDWELAHLGDPMEDLAWLCLRCWRFGRDAWAVGGLAAREPLQRAYERAGGLWREDAFHWWTVARTVWWALGLARQAQTFLDGQTRSIVLAASGRRVVELESDLLRAIGD